MATHYEGLQAQLEALRKEQQEIQADAISGCLFTLQELDLLQNRFSESLWDV